MSNEFKHYGILRKSGRYPWGSGRDDYGRSMMFYQLVDSLKSQGLKETEIAQAIGLKVAELTGDSRDSFSVADLRSTRTIAKEQIVLDETNRAVALRDKGVSIKAIAEELGMPQPTVRLRLKNSEAMKESSLRATANVIRDAVDKHTIVDIGKGTELHLGIADTKMKSALAVLRDEGYETYKLQTPQVGTNQFTNQMVIVPPGTGFGAAKRMTDQIHTMGVFSEDDGATYSTMKPPLNVSSKRLKVNFDEDGGTAADGVVYVRPGVPDLDMGKNRYAQVRISVDGSHYIKGMAVLKDDLPDGVDLVFNTNKKRGTPILGDKDNSVLKPLKRDKDGNVDMFNPFGSMIKRQIMARDKDGNEVVKSALNLVNEAGDWDDWRKSLPSQMLAKQPHSLIKSQLEVTRQSVKDRIAEIDRITNPVVRKKAFEDFAEKIDSDAVDLRAAAMPRQLTQVIIPMPKMNKGEIYAPRFETGERVVLIRYPHGGRFEIPEVTVNNNNRTAKKLLGDAVDAIGIHPSVAERLSGADFDGDTVVVIPNRAGKIKGSQSMGSQAKVYEDGLKNFDPKRKYGGYEEKDGRPLFPVMKNTGLEMGMITNLITDMSIQGAKPEHVVRAVRHSMVVIDAEKHKLNYKQSEIDNGISQLKTLYQGGPKKGATTLLSQATATDRVPDFKPRPAKDGGVVDKVTGEKVYVPTGKQRNKYDAKTRTYLDEKEDVTREVKRLARTNNAFDLVRDPKDPVERLYASHANEMKTMANAARLRALKIPSPKINPQAKAVYKEDIDKLVADLRAAQKQKPLDRRAQVVALTIVRAKRQEDPTLAVDKDRRKKVERQALEIARNRLNLKKPVIDISERQWDAIQAGGVSASRLREILGYADPKQIETLSMPRPNQVMTTAISSRAKAMLAAGATTADVAAALGISASTLRAAAERGDV